MGRLCIKAAEFSYAEHYRQLKEQFTNNIDNEEVMLEIVKEPTAQGTPQK